MVRTELKAICLIYICFIPAQREVRSVGIHDAVKEGGGGRKGEEKYVYMHACMLRYYFLRFIVDQESLVLRDE